jgi:hypothetical protein
MQFQSTPYKSVVFCREMSGNVGKKLTTVSEFEA